MGCHLEGLCSSGIRKAKAHLELNLARDAKNKKGFTAMFATKVRLKKIYRCNKQDRTAGDNQQRED